MHPITHAKDTNWQNVLRAWQQAEEEVWRPHYEGRGFPSWEAWRLTYYADLNLHAAPWRMGTLANPEVIADWHVGGFQGWKRYRPQGEALTTFRTIARHPDLPQNSGVHKILDGGLHATMLIALTSGEKWAILDGTHRAAAIAHRAAAMALRTTHHPHGLVWPTVRVMYAEIPWPDFANFCADRPSLTGPLFTS